MRCVATPPVTPRYEREALLVFRHTVSPNATNTIPPAMNPAVLSSTANTHSSPRTRPGARRQALWLLIVRSQNIVSNRLAKIREVLQTL